MIPRYQTILLVILVLASAGMGVGLWHMRERAHQRLLSAQDSAPTQAPQVAPAEQATLLVADDDDNSLRTQLESLPLPQDPNARARAILGKLLDLYATPDSAHHIPGGASSISQIFLLPALDLQTAPHPSPQSRSTEHQTSPASTTAPELAVVNLTSAFVAGHPSGLETENLTILSICGTLHANLPRITQIRFLVDGQPHTTLAGHADLTRTYLETEAAPTESSHP